MSRGIRHALLRCHPEAPFFGAEGPMHFLSGEHDCMGPFDKLRAGSSRQERAQDDKQNFWEAVQ